jgi:hypothetical protein
MILRRLAAVVAAAMLLMGCGSGRGTPAPESSEPSQAPVDSGPNIGFQVVTSSVAAKGNGYGTVQVQLQFSNTGSEYAEIGASRTVTLDVAEGRQYPARMDASAGTTLIQFPSVPIFPGWTVCGGIGGRFLASFDQVPLAAHPATVTIGDIGAASIASATSACSGPSAVSLPPSGADDQVSFSVIGAARTVRAGLWAENFYSTPITVVNKSALDPVSIEVWALTKRGYAIPLYIPDEAPFCGQIESGMLDRRWLSVGPGQTLTCDILFHVNGDVVNQPAGSGDVFGSLVEFAVMPAGGGPALYVGARG